MPALITHDLFGRKVYEECVRLIGESPGCRRAFLLGNQGPDPLFYAFLSPGLFEYRNLGSKLHSEYPSKLLLAFRESLDYLGDDERAVGKAYAAGFVCHYLLDSSVHPLVYRQVFELCDAGVEGLDSNDKSEVHQTIEAEYDEMMLYTNLGRTIASFNPATHILRAKDAVLDTTSKMHCYVAMKIHGLFVSPRLFKQSVRNFRFAQHALHSPTGQKRLILAQIEILLRQRSTIGAISLRDVALEESVFENAEHKEWRNPFTEESSTQSFLDLYGHALARAQGALELYCGDLFRLEEAKLITRGKNFSGKPVEED